MIEITNIGSIVLGLTAWILPVINIMLVRRNRSWDRGTLAALSLGACAASIWLLHFYTYHKVTIEDWSAVLDTTGAITRVTGVLLIVTLLLNSVTYLLYRKRQV